VRPDQKQAYCWPPEEARFLDMLRDSLELDKLTTAGIERGIRARNFVL
jgi:hypothetical protein